MSLKTYSGFIYGHDITDTNSWLDFTEGAGPELSTEVAIGSYTLDDFVNAVLNALNGEGALDYTATINRATRKVTISASGTFGLLVTTGTHTGISAFSLLGFTANKTGSSSYTSDVESGLFYEPQYKLQRFVTFEDNVEFAQTSVNTSASGLVEVVSFGQNQFMECNITYATDITGQGAIKNNVNGVSDLRAFMNYLIRKKPIQFIPDIDTPSAYYDCLLEKTTSSSNGTGFQLYELYGRGLANYYETQTLTFRRLF
jgi:hypothetical protein